MSYTIAKTFSFSASHSLPLVPDDHPCRRLHGHNYTVTLTLSSLALDFQGFVVDYRALSTFKDYLDTTFDHRHLNDFLPNPTAENIAFLLYTWCKERWPQTSSVRVSESPTSWAEYTP